MVGAGRAPCTEDRLRMPYTNAVIHELQRFHRTRIENFPRMTTQDVPFRGYTIPKVHSAPEPLPPRDCTDICLCPCTVCTPRRAPALSQSSSMTFQRGAEAAECYCLCCPHPLSLFHPGKQLFPPCRAGGQSRSPPWGGARPDPPALSRSGDSRGLTTSLVCKTHPEGTPALGSGAVRGASAEIHGSNSVVCVP